MKPLILALHGAVVMAIPFLGASEEPETLRGDPRGLNFPLSSTETDDRPPMSFDARKPYRLEFGRGSGWHGLDTIAIEDGKVILHRLGEDKKGNTGGIWVSGTMQIPKDATERIVKTIVDLDLLEMNRSYHADIADGTQWIFWLTQDGQEKSIYFDNHFPKAIQEFARSLDEELAKAGLAKAEWSRVPDEERRSHENRIWDSIKNHPDGKAEEKD